MRLQADEKAAIIDAMGKCRSAALALKMHVERKTIVWREAECLIRQLDDLALVFLGNREFFHGQGRGSSPPGDAQ